MNIVGLPAAKLGIYRTTDDLSKTIKEYAPLPKDERAARIDEDLVTLRQQREQIRTVQAEAHNNAKKGLYTMAAGLGSTVALGFAGDAIPGTAGLMLKLGSAAVTGVGIYSLFKNVNVRDFDCREAHMSTNTQIDFLNDWKRS